MARRTKKNSLFNILERQKAELNLSNLALSTENLNSDIQIKSSFCDKDDEELKLESSNVKLFAENSQLTDKLSEYFNEIEKLRKENELSKEILNENNILKKQISSLTEENDKYLLKISELTFENAKLQAEYKNQNSHQANEIKQNTNYPQIFANQVPYYSHNNGYDSWN